MKTFEYYALVIYTRPLRYNNGDLITITHNRIVTIIGTDFENAVSVATHKFYNDEYYSATHSKLIKIIDINDVQSIPDELIVTIGNSLRKLFKSGEGDDPGITFSFRNRDNYDQFAEIFENEIKLRGFTFDNELGFFVMSIPAKIARKRIKVGDMILCKPIHYRSQNSRRWRKVTSVVHDPANWEMSGIAVNAHGYSDFWLKFDEIESHISI